MKDKIPPAGDKKEKKAKWRLCDPVLPEDEDQHYEWGASSAKQWRGCKGSIKLIQEMKAAGKILAKSETEYSIEGTEAHAYADAWLKGLITPEEVPPSFHEHLDGYVDFCEEVATAAGVNAMRFTEQKIPLFYNEERFGTIDFAVATDDEVHFIDLKYGAGEKVDAFENDQLMIYAISGMAFLMRKHHPRFHEDTKVNICIYQPRHRSFDGLPEIWTTTYRDLLDYAPDILSDYEESKKASSGDLRPSYSACRFCDARRVCHARVNSMFEDLPDEFNPLTNDPTTEKMKTVHITDEIRARIAARAKEITKFFEELNEDSLEKIEAGVSIAGLKSIDGGKGNRKWGDNETDADKLLRKLPAHLRYQPKKLISPAQAEKILKKHDVPLDAQSVRFQNRWNELIQQSDGGPKLALDSDPRPARITGAKAFEDEVDEDDCF